MIDKTNPLNVTLPVQSAGGSAGVKLTALESFHSSPTGMVAARAPFETHWAHADELIARGLAEEVQLANAAAPVAMEKQRK